MSDCSRSFARSPISFSRSHSASMVSGVSISSRRHFVPSSQPVSPSTRQVNRRANSVSPEQISIASEGVAMMAVPIPTDAAAIRIYLIVVSIRIEPLRHNPPQAQTQACRQPTAGTTCPSWKLPRYAILNGVWCRRSHGEGDLDPVTSCRAASAMLQSMLLGVVEVTGKRPEMWGDKNATSRNMKMRKALPPGEVKQLILCWKAVGCGTWILT